MIQDSSTAIVTVPTYSGGRASRDYARGAAVKLRRAVRQIIEGGTRRHADIATALNELGRLSPTGRPWDAGSVGRLCKRLGITSEAVAKADAEAIEDHVFELWNMGVQTPPQVAIALNRWEIPCASGGNWTAGKARTMLGRIKGHWMTDCNVPLRKGNTVPPTSTLPPEVELVIATPEPEPVLAVELPAVEPLAAELANQEPREAAPRRRAIRARPH